MFTIGKNETLAIAIFCVGIIAAVTILAYAELKTDDCTVITTSTIQGDTTVTVRESICE
ncbi:MAG: hypothetical protein P8O06_05120 [Porticoccaceae bacterium]|jgi:hypothetical protein|nr:hypothetical protein [Porticoccaceae bacterium]